jgi:lysozyme
MSARMTTARTSRSSRYSCWNLAVLAAAAAVAAGCSAGAGDKYGTSASELSQCAGSTTLRGVDVSSYQGSINWSAAKASGITFGFAKATEGQTLVDSTFHANWSNMKAAGVVRGAYHFFHPNESATAQANFVLQTVGALGAGDLPIVLDFEVLDGVSEATAVSDAVTFLQTVSNATGKTAILYMSSAFLSGSYSALSRYTLWVANYGVSCPGLPREWSSWTFWQNSDSGNVSGISGGTDTDIFNGSLAALTALAGGSSPPPPPPPPGGSTCTLGGHTYAQNACTETQQCDAGAWVARSSDPSSCATGTEPGGACVTDGGAVVPQDTCTATLQCDNGVWVDRMTDPAMCLGSSTTSCTLAGKTYAQNTCTDTLQCDSGSWVSRSSDPASCNTGVEPNGACVTDAGAVVPQNTCTSTLQCDNGVWVARSSDPSACL